MKTIDPLQLQRLVDGELSVEQTQRLLHEANESPDQWREIAVGFVENQTWNHAFQLPELDLVPVVASQPINEISNAKPTTSRHAGSNLSWLVMAASLVAAAAIGYMFSEIQSRNLPGPIAVSETLAPRPLLANLPTEQLHDDAHPQMTQADYHLELPAEQLGELGSAGPLKPVPLYAVDNPEQLRRLNELSRWQSTPAVSDEVLRQLVGSGYQMKQDVDYVSGQLEDGRSFVVPIRTIRFAAGQ